MIIDINGKVVNLEAVLLKGIVQGVELERDLLCRDEELLRYTKMLKRYIPNDWGQNNFVEKELKLLTIGCGICLEAKELYNHFKKEDNLVRLIGVDIDTEKIEYAQQQYASFGERMRFISGDARELDQLVQGTADVVVMSHPEILYSNVTWKKIVHNVMKVNVAGGLWLNTFYFEREMDKMQEIIAPDYEIIFKGRNEYAKEVVSFFCPHQYLIVARKK